MFPDPKKCCHRTGFSKYCHKLVQSGACQDRWVSIQGVNKNTGEEINKFGCVDDHAYLIQLGMEARLMGVQAAVENRGNSMIQMQAEAIARQERQHREAMNLLPVAAELPAGASLKAISHNSHPNEEVT